MNLRRFWTGEDSSKFSSAPHTSAEAARRQMAAAVVCLLALAAGAWLLLTWLSGRDDAALSDGTWLTHEGRVYQRVEDSATLSLLGVSALTTAECGQQLAELTEPAALKGATLHTFSGADSRALLTVKQGKTVFLYQFAYFDDPSAHSGADILAVCGDHAALKAVYIVTGQKGWRSTITDPSALSAFETLFGGLTPLPETDKMKAVQNRSGAWDAVITLTYDNGLTMHLTLYRDEAWLTGFRCVYPLPGDLTALLRTDAT